MEIMLVNTESPGWNSGLKAGDIILEIEGKPVNNINDYRKQFGENADKG